MSARLHDTFVNTVAYDHLESANQDVSKILPHRTDDTALVWSANAAVFEEVFTRLPTLRLRRNPYLYAAFPDPERL